MHYKFHFSSRLLLIIFFCLLIYIQIVANFIKNHSTSPNKNVALQVRYFCFHLFHTGKLQSKSYSKKIEYIRWSAEWISKWRWHSYSEWRAEQCKVHGVFGDFYLKQTSILWIVRGKPEFSLNVQKLVQDFTVLSNINEKSWNFRMFLPS